MPWPSPADHLEQAARHPRPRLLLRGRLADRGGRLALHRPHGGHEAGRRERVAHIAGRRPPPGRQGLLRPRRHAAGRAALPGAGHGRRLPLLPLGVPEGERLRGEQGLGGRDLGRPDHHEGPRAGRGRRVRALGRRGERRLPREQRSERTRRLQRRPRSWAARSGSSTSRRASRWRSASSTRPAAAPTARTTRRIPSAACASRWRPRRRSTTSTATASRT